jgi:glutamine amidotransferase
MDALRERNLDGAMRDFIDAGRPFLGICVGMQILYAGSDEFGAARGLGVFPARITRFVSAPRVPHMGWNRLEVVRDHPFIHDIGPEPYAYFLHSYRAPVGEETVAAATHGERFSAVVARGNVMGTQFHPEKSQATGAILLQNFLSIAKGTTTK